MADLPYPVGRETNVSFPDINVKTASNCLGFKEYPNNISEACLIASLILSVVDGGLSISRSNHRLYSRYPGYET